MSAMKQAHYWAQQEDRWHQQYLMAEQLCDKLERRIHDLEQAIIDADKYPMPLELRQKLRSVLEGNHADR